MTAATEFLGLRVRVEGLRIGEDGKIGSQLAEAYSTNLNTQFFFGLRKFFDGLFRNAATLPPSEQIARGNEMGIKSGLKLYQPRSTN